MVINIKQLYRDRYRTQYVSIRDDLDDGSVHTTELPITVLGTGQPVLLIHAFGMDARQFLPFILPLCIEYRFYLPHMRGFGLADKIAVGQFDFIEQYASDIEYIINYIQEAEGIDQLPVAGISMGALVMWAYFSRFGDSKISRYLNIDQIPAIHRQSNWAGLYGDAQTQKFAEFQTVLDMALPYMDDDDTKITEFSHLPFAVKQAITNMAYQFSLSSVSRGITTQAIKLLRYQPDYKLALLQDNTWQHQLRCLQAYMTLPYDYRAVLNKVTTPVTVLIGGRSKLYDMNEQLSISDQLVNTKTVILPKSGHAVPVDAPIGFYRTLKQFLHD